MDLESRLSEAEKEVRTGGGKDIFQFFPPNYLILKGGHINV